LAGKLLWKLFQTYFTGMAKSVALDLTNQVLLLGRAFKPKDRKELPRKLLWKFFLEMLCQDDREAALDLTNQGVRHPPQVLFC